MAGYFREGKFVEGGMPASNTAGARLAAYFPRAGDDVNELPNSSEGK